MIKSKLLRILNIIESKNKSIHVIEINEPNIVNEIDEILGKNKFLYYPQPSNINLCLIYKKKNTYFVKLYWINEALKDKNLK